MNDLTKAFNSMSKNLYFHVENLDKLIMERTSELTGANNRLKQEIDVRKKTEIELEKEKERLAVTLRSIGDGVITTDIYGNIVLMNKIASELTGWLEEEAVDKPIHEVFHIIDEESRKRCENPVEKAIKARGIIDLGNGTILISKDGTNRIVADSGSPIWDGNGEIIGVVLVFRDITGKINMETLLQQAQTMEAIATFAGGIAHQFNNALSPVSVNLDMLEMHYPGDERIAKYNKQMKDSVHRMVQLTSQLLAYARGGKYQAETISINDFIDHTLPIIHPSINPDIGIETDLTTDILNIKADKTQIQTALSAILVNASEAIEGKGFIRISIKKEECDEDLLKYHSNLKPGQYVCIKVEDNGKGMGKETRDRIFEPFFTTKFEGRGLVMAAAFGIVQNHDGRISVYSEIGRGTVVRIYLPLIEALREEPKKPEAEPIKGSGTILLIEDEQIVMDVSRALLERMGYNVLATMTGEEAVNIAKTFDGHIDLAILDLILPDMEGGAIYPLIMEARPNLKVIVCSGFSIDGPAQKILDAGAQGFLQKPVNMANLSEQLKRAMEGK